MVARQLYCSWGMLSPREVVEIRVVVRRTKGTIE